MARIILFNKPYGVLSQFTDERTGPPRPTLAQFIDLPGVYPAGRLDHDSEGLLVLCDDGRLQARIADPRFKLAKTYLVQVEGEPGEDALAGLRTGVKLKDGLTRPADVERIAPPTDLLDCAPDPVVPEAPDQRAVASYLIDLWEAGADCRRKLGAVRGFVAAE